MADLQAKFALIREAVRAGRARWLWRLARPLPIPEEVPRIRQRVVVWRSMSWACDATRSAQRFQVSPTRSFWSLEQGAGVGPGGQATEAPRPRRQRSLDRRSEFRFDRRSQRLLRSWNWGVNGTSSSTEDPTNGAPIARRPANEQARTDRRRW